MTVPTHKRSKLRSFLIRFGVFSKPSFLIIGAQKSGTTALHRYLSWHPQLKSPAKKEIGYFSMDTNFSKGHNWYHKHFPPPHKLLWRKFTYESTPEYLYYPTCAERIKKYNPEIKLLVVLRNPVDRAYSAWNHFRHFFLRKQQWIDQTIQEWDEPVQAGIKCMAANKKIRAFEDLVSFELRELETDRAQLEPSLVRRGLYYDQLIHYLQHFSPHQIMVVDSRELKENSVSVLDNVSQFLGLIDYDWNQNQIIPTHVRAYPEPMLQRTRCLLADFYAPHNEKLYDLLDVNFGWS